jgi:hypothetical protein
MAAAALTLSEAACVLDPPVTEAQLRLIVRALGWAPADHRHNGRGSGRPAAAYNLADLMRLHAAIAPWLVLPQ